MDDRQVCEIISQGRGASEFISPWEFTGISDEPDYFVDLVRGVKAENLERELTEFMKNTFEGWYYPNTDVWATVIEVDGKVDITGWEERRWGLGKLKGAFRWMDNFLVIEWSLTNEAD